jgi:hypothetical protein
MAEERSVKRKRLINVAHTKKFLLSVSEQYRHSKFTRVSADTLSYLEGRMIQICEELVRTHPTVGTTIFPPYTKTKPDRE